MVQAGRSVASDSNYHNGSYGEGTFQNDWRDELPHADTAAVKFREQVDNSTTTRFGTYNMHGSAVPGLWHDSCDTCAGGGLDTADIVFIATHGGAWSAPDTATWTMGDVDVRAKSMYMRLGDEDDQLQIFAAMSCDTMSDAAVTGGTAAMWSRWSPIMKGGLYAAVSSHGTIWFGYYSRRNGLKFAKELQDGNTIRYAWRDGMGAGTYDQDVKALYTGSTAAECENRRSGMTWANTASYGVRRDGSINYWCASAWDNQ